MEVPKPDFALHPPPLCEAVTEDEYARFIDVPEVQVCRWTCFISPYSIALRTYYVTVVEDRPILSAEYRLALLATTDHLATRSLCDGCLFSQRVYKNKETLHIYCINIHKLQQEHLKTIALNTSVLSCLHLLGLFHF